MQAFGERSSSERRHEEDDQGFGTFGDDDEGKDDQHEKGEDDQHKDNHGDRDVVDLGGNEEDPTTLDIASTLPHEACGMGVLIGAANGARGIEQRNEQLRAWHVE